MRTLSLTLAFVIALALTVAAPRSWASQPDIGFKGIGPRLGFVDPEGSLDGTFEFGADVQLGEWVPQLKWDASLSYWKSTQTWGYLNHNYDWSLSDLALRTGVNYHFIKGPWEPYAGGGLALHMFSWDYANSPGYGNTDDNQLGIYVDGGVNHQFNKKWSGQAQFQLDFADWDQTQIFLQAIYALGK